LAALAFGLMLLFQPMITLVVLTTIMGIYWLVDGILKSAGAFTSHRSDPNWWLFLVSGLLSIAGGIIVISQPVFSTYVTQLVALYLLAGQAILGGVLSIFWAFRMRKEMDGELGVILGGALSIALGLLLVSSPIIAVKSLVMISAWLTIIGSLGLFVLAFRWYKITS
jgi:uncharacterized membrane protein HdeD (DUF308 family)